MNKLRTSVTRHCWQLQFRDTDLWHRPWIYINTGPWTDHQSSAAVWKSRWPSWAPRPNEPHGFCGRKATLNTHWSQFVSKMSTDIRGHEAVHHHQQTVMAMEAEAACFCCFRFIAFYVFDVLCKCWVERQNNRPVTCLIFYENVRVSAMQNNRPAENVQSVRWTPYATMQYVRLEITWSSFARTHGDC